MSQTNSRIIAYSNPNNFFTHRLRAKTMVDRSRRIINCQLRMNIMNAARANTILETTTYRTFKNKERLDITVDELSQTSIYFLLQLMGVRESEVGALTNIGMKYTKGGVCRIKVGSSAVAGIVINIPDAGKASEFKTTLLERWDGVIPSCFADPDEIEISEVTDLADEPIDNTHTELTDTTTVGVIGGHREGMTRLSHATMGAIIAMGINGAYDTPHNREYDNEELPW